MMLLSLNRSPDGPSVLFYISHGLFVFAESFLILEIEAADTSHGNGHWPGIHTRSWQMPEPFPTQRESQGPCDNGSQLGSWSYADEMKQ